MSDDEIDACKRGGHDFRKLLRGLRAPRSRTRASRPSSSPRPRRATAWAGRASRSMTSHQQKKLDIDALQGVPRSLPPAAVGRRCRSSCAFYSPADDSPEMRYLQRAPRRARRLSAAASQRSVASAIAVPPLAELRAVRPRRPTARRCRPRWRSCACSAACCKDKQLGPRIVPIVADEARTFGMANLFRQIGIYSPLGQLYEPEDAGSMLSYREATRRAAAGGGHYRGRRAVVVDRGRDVLQRARPADAAVLHLLLDVRLPARRRSHLGRRRSARARLSDRRDRRAHDARRRRACSIRTAAAISSRRPMPNCRAYDPGVRVRSRGDRRSRHARDAGAGSGRVLLHHRDERELRASVGAGRQPRRCIAACGHPQGHLPAFSRSCR